jgi:hypothetical protein
MFRGSEGAEKYSAPAHLLTASGVPLLGKSSKAVNYDVS